MQVNPEGNDGRPNESASGVVVDEAFGWMQVSRKSYRKGHGYFRLARGWPLRIQGGVFSMPFWEQCFVFL